MNTDVEELLREGMERFGQDLRMPAGIAARARGRLRRRRLQAVTGATVAVAAAVAIVSLTATPGARPAPVRLAAWTVITEPNGTVAVSINDVRDPAGLQRALRAHGVPATVRFYPGGSLMPGCVTSVPSRLATVERRVFVQPPAGSQGHGQPVPTSILLPCPALTRSRSRRCGGTGSASDWSPMMANARPEAGRAEPGCILHSSNELVKAAEGAEVPPAAVPAPVTRRCLSAAVGRSPSSACSRTRKASYWRIASQVLPSAR